MSTCRRVVTCFARAEALPSRFHRNNIDAIFAQETMIPRHSRRPGAPFASMSGLERSFVVCVVFSLTGFVASGSLLLRSRSLDRSQILPITAESSQSHPVRVQFIGEALCPDCAAFTAKVLEPIFSSGLSDLIDFDFIGWGNAKNNSGEIKCQHGPKECELNIVLNCARHLSKSQEVFFSFLSCLEKKAFHASSADVLQLCTSDEKISEKALHECTFGGQGTHSLHQASDMCSIPGPRKLAPENHSQYLDIY